MDSSSSDDQETKDLRRRLHMATERGKVITQEADELNRKKKEKKEREKAELRLQVLQAELSVVQGALDLRRLHDEETGAGAERKEEHQKRDLATTARKQQQQQQEPVDWSAWGPTSSGKSFLNSFSLSEASFGPSSSRSSIPQPHEPLQQPRRQGGAQHNRGWCGGRQGSEEGAEVKRRGGEGVERYYEAAEAEEEDEVDRTRTGMGVVRGVGSLGVSVYKSVISASVGMGGCFQPPSSQWGAGAWGTESSRKGAVVALKVK